MSDADVIRRLVEEMGRELTRREAREKQKLSVSWWKRASGK